MHEILQDTPSSLFLLIRTTPIFGCRIWGVIELLCVRVLGRAVRRHLSLCGSRVSAKSHTVLSSNFARLSGGRHLRDSGRSDSLTNLCFRGPFRNTQSMG